MRTVAEIDTDIAHVKSEMLNVRGSTTEVYARIVGYYRSVRNWNPGKREEYRQRKIFIADKNRIDEHLQKTGEPCPVNNENEISPDSAVISRYELFMRKTCPNCPPVKEYCGRLDLTGEHLDVDSADGYARASAYGIFSAPTVIFFDKNGNEITRAHTVNEMKTALSAQFSGESILSAVV